MLIISLVLYGCALAHQTAHVASFGQVLASATATAACQATPALATYTVKVGADGYNSTPSFIHTYPGSIIHFHLSNADQNLTESNGRPCELIVGRIDAHFRQLKHSKKHHKLVIEYLVLDREPQWFYCSHRRNNSECDQGIVFRLNPHQGATVSPAPSLAPEWTNTFSNYNNTPNSSFQVTQFLSSLSSSGQIGPSSIRILPAIDNRAPFTQVASISYSYIIFVIICSVFGI